MLTQEAIDKVERFVRLKPRSVQEVARLVGRNWRTAASYIDRIADERGTIATRTFRGGTRGALKVVYWNESDHPGGSAFQEALLQRVQQGRDKGDFNPFDIYQYVPEKSRRAFLEEQTAYRVTEKQGLAEALRSAEHQILIFSGDFSWALASQGDVTLFSLLEEAVRRGVSVKVLCRVDLESVENVGRALSLNGRVKRELVEVRHAEQPLRAFVIDGKMARFKHQKDGGKKGRQFIFYEVFDEDWVEWVRQVFWNLFRKSIGAEERIRDLESIERIS
ncbi:hypothetical protein KY327_01495 [Candidatus Woesearchaeota archaeon]|nr:hypothetical protein [Candidatus Woesearchaeota archaeon]